MSINRPKCPMCNIELDYKKIEFCPNCGKKFDSNDFLRIANEVKLINKKLYTVNLRMASKLGNSEAMFLLGMVYYQNNADYFDPMDEKMRKKWYEHSFTESAKLNYYPALDILVSLRSNLENIDGIRIANEEFYRRENLRAKEEREKKELATRERMQRIEKKQKLEAERKRLESISEQQKKNGEFLEFMRKQYLNVIVYHKAKGEGKIISIYGNSFLSAYCDIDFNGDIAKFIIPKAFEDGYLSLTNIWTNKPISEMNYKEHEIFKEKEFLEKVIEECKKETENEHKIEKLKSPYFASVITNRDGLFRIGKFGICNLVTDWREPVCATYYNYTGLIGENKLGVSLIRDHEISDSCYVDYIDKFNIECKDIGSVIDFNENVSNKNILKYRNTRRTHEIIETIDINQYNPISDLGNDNMLVTGCAGSGKTVVLFHKIAYMAFNLKSYRPENYCVISQNILSDFELNKLSNELDISRIHIVDKNSLYSEILNSIVVKNSRLRYMPEEKNSSITDFHIYKKDFLESLLHKVIALKDQSDQYIKYREERLISAFESIFNANIPQDVRSIEYIKNNFYSMRGQEFFAYLSESIPYINAKALVKLKDDLSPEQRILSDFLLKNLYERLAHKKIISYDSTDFIKFNRLFEYVKNDDIIQSAFGLEKSYRSIVYYSDYFKFYKIHKNNYFLIKDIPSLNRNVAMRFKKKDASFLKRYFSDIMDSKPQYVFYNGELNLFAENINKLLSYISYDVSDTISLLSYNVEGTKSLVRLFDSIKYEEFLDSYLEYKKGNWKDEIFNIIDYVLSTDYAIKNINDKIFLYCYLTSQLGLMVSNSYNQIFIDDFQNYSPAELRMLMSLYPNATFNLFGDLNQRLDEKGILYLEELPFDNLHRYDLNINYRNSKAVCDYINNKFNMKMISTGFPGSVKEISGKERIVVSNKDDRIAIIAKDKSYINLLNVKKSDINFIDSFNKNIKTGIINYLNVNDIKGLEFEKVIVITKDMTDIDKYLSFSRALNDLLIVK